MSFSSVCFLLVLLLPGACSCYRSGHGFIFLSMLGCLTQYACMMRPPDPDQHRQIHRHDEDALYDQVCGADTDQALSIL